MEPWFGSVNLQLFDHSACGDLAGPCCSGIQEFLTTRFPFTPYVVENYRCWAWVEIAAMWTTIHWDCRPKDSKMVEPHTQIKLWAMGSFVMFFCNVGRRDLAPGNSRIYVDILTYIKAVSLGSWKLVPLFSTGISGIRWHVGKHGDRPAWNTGLHRGHRRRGHWNMFANHGVIKQADKAPITDEERKSFQYFILVRDWEL